MSVDADPFRRVVAAAEIIGHHYATRDAAALEAAGDGWRDEAVAMLADAVAALLVELPPTRRDDRRRR